MKKKWLLFGVLGLSAFVQAQSPWPAVQAKNYPLVDSMKLVRHEQSILLGEADQQTGLFYAQLGQAYTERVQNQLIDDASRKGWKLQSVMRYGTQYVLAFSRNSRLLDIRLLNTPDGVDAVYSVVLNQSGSDAAPAADVSAQESRTGAPAVAPVSR